MANEQNLISLKDRTQRERNEIAKKGAAASNEKQKEKKTFRKLAETLLELDIKDDEIVSELKNMGIEKDSLSYKTLCVLGIINKAQDGDVKAFEKLQELTGEIEQDNNKNVMDKLDQVLGGIDALANE